MITDSQKEELIFDFLEGNLSAEEEEAFRILKDESEMFSREIRLWQNTYVEEPLPAIEALEKKLLIPAGSGNGNLMMRIFTVMLIMFYITIPADQANELAPDFKELNTLNVSPGPAPEIVSDCRGEVRRVRRGVRRRPEWRANLELPRHRDSCRGRYRVGRGLQGQPPRQQP